MESKIIYGIVVALCIASIPSAYAEFTFDFDFGSSGRGELTEPTDVILDRSDRRIYVVDKGSDRISVFNDDGRFPTHHGEFCDIASLNNCTDQGDGQFNDPTSIAKNRSTFFVVDSENHRIQVFAENDWSFDSEFGSSGTNDLKLPVGIAFHDSGDGRIIVSDYTDDSILVFNIDGELEFEFGLNGVDDIQPTGFNQPTNMVVDNDRLYVSDTHNDRIVILDLKDSCRGGSEEIRDGVCFVDVFGERW